MLPSLIFLTATVNAATVTDLPPQFRGDVAIGYRATIVPDTLKQNEATVGERRTIDHALTYTGLLGLTDFLAVELQLPHTVSHEIRFKNTNSMVYDPITETGTMIGTDPMDDSKLSGKGLEGTRLRIMGTPFSETVFSERGDQITWKIGIGVQFADKTNIWTAENGERGAGPASPAFEFDSFWSTKNQHASPYLGVSWARRSPNSNGPVPVKDPSDVLLTSGLEIPLWEDPTWADGLGTDVALNLSGQFGYHTYGDGVSGVLLPTVLPISKGSAVTQSETSSLWGHIDLRWRAARYIDWSMNGSMGGVFGHRLEHHYPIVTDTKGKMAWALGTELRFRMRDPLFDAN